MRIVLWLLVLASTCSACSPSGPLEVEIAVGSGDRVYPFEFVASGPAVDQGMMCAGGDVEEADARFRAAEISVAENRFVCDDGSGSFVTETVIDQTGFEGEGLPVGDWSVVSGTGAYEKLRGDGSHRYLGVSDVYAESPLDAVVQVISGEVSSD
jgi:hypothetical protein